MRKPCAGLRHPWSEQYLPLEVRQCVQGLKEHERTNVPKQRAESCLKGHYFTQWGFVIKGIVDTHVFHTKRRTSQDAETHMHMDDWCVKISVSQRSHVFHTKLRHTHTHMHQPDFDLPSLVLTSKHRSRTWPNTESKLTSLRIFQAGMLSLFAVIYIYIQVSSCVCVCVTSFLFSVWLINCRCFVAIGGCFVLTRHKSQVESTCVF